MMFLNEANTVKYYILSNYENSKQKMSDDDDGGLDQNATFGGAGKPLGLALNLDAVAKQDQIAEAKEQMYDQYDASSSRRRGEQKASAAKPKFKLDMAALASQEHRRTATNAPQEPDDKDEKLQGFGVKGAGKQVGITPSNVKSRAFPGLGIGGGDALSMMSTSPMNADKISARFKAARMGAGGIPTPLGSDMSRAKLDFSGYDPKAMRKKKEQSPDVKVLKKVEDDMEIFMTDTTENPSVSDFDKKNIESSEAAREKVVDQIFDSQAGLKPGDPEESKLERLVDVETLRSNIHDDAINAQNAYDFFNKEEYKAVQKEQNLHDLQHGGMAYEDAQLMNIDAIDQQQQSLTSLKLERLALEMNQLEKELTDLQKTDIPNGYSDENDAQKHIKEIQDLRVEMEKMLSSEAFQSLEGKKIQNHDGAESSGVQTALDQLIQEQIDTCQTKAQQDEAESNLQMTDTIHLNYQGQKDIKLNNEEIEKDILNKYQQVDSTLHFCEQIIGGWQPQNKFTTIYAYLDDLCDKCEHLSADTTSSITLAGEKAKKLNTDLEEIVKQLEIMNNTSLDKNKIDFLFQMLEQGLESGEHAKMINERLKALEKIHKDSPNIKTSIDNLAERQKIIDLAFKTEDADINKTKKLFIDSMNNIQQELKEVTILQKTMQIKSA